MVEHGGAHTMKPNQLKSWCRVTWYGDALVQLGTKQVKNRFHEATTIPFWKMSCMRREGLSPPACGAGLVF